MSKHTPGPWSVDHSDAVKIRDRHKNSLAMMMFVHHGGRRDSNEVNANARLIAAAPTMTGTLLELLDYFDDRSDVLDGDDGQPVPNKEMRFASEIRDVLTKAGIDPEAP